MKAYDAQKSKPQSSVTGVNSSNATISDTTSSTQGSSVSSSKACVQCGGEITGGSSFYSVDNGRVHSHCLKAWESANADPKNLCMHCGKLIEGGQSFFVEGDGKIHSTCADAYDAAQDAQKGTSESNEDDGDEVEGKPQSDNNITETDWEELIDSASGDTYYYNSCTGETTWDKVDLLLDSLSHVLFLYLPPYQFCNSEKAWASAMLWERAKM